MGTVSLHITRQIGLLGLEYGANGVASVATVAWGDEWGRRPGYRTAVLPAVCRGLDVGSYRRRYFASGGCDGTICVL